MAPVLDQLSNALIAESGAKRLIKNTPTSKQQVNKQCRIRIKEQAEEMGQPFTHIRIVYSTKANLVWWLQTITRQARLGLETNNTFTRAGCNHSCSTNQIAALHLINIFGG